MATPPSVIAAAIEWANETEAENAKQTAAAELRLKALRAAKKNTRKR